MRLNSLFQVPYTITINQIEPYNRVLNTLIKIFFLCATIMITACASVSPLEQANIETDVIYKFINPTLSTSLYVKILPVKSEDKGLLFKTVKNSETVDSLEIGAPGVYHQKSYFVSERGKVSFRFFEQGLFESLLKFHQYTVFGSQQEKYAAFRYRLDFRKAIKIR